MVPGTDHIIIFLYSVTDNLSDVVIWSLGSSVNNALFYHDSARIISDIFPVDIFDLLCTVTAVNTIWFNDEVS